MKLMVLVFAAFFTCISALKAQEVQPNSGQEQKVETTQEGRAKRTEIHARSATAPGFQPLETQPLDSPEGLPTPSQEQLQNLILEHWKQLPDSPQPKAGSKENNMCPAGVGNSCALLGGWAYYPDSIGLSYHNRTWWDAMKNPGMLAAMLLLIGTTALDVEGSQACLDKHVCKELNPLMRGPKVQKYAIAMSADGLITWLAVLEKQHGKGNLVFGTMWIISLVHSYFGIEGLYEARTR